LLAGDLFEKHTVDLLAMYVAVEGLRKLRDATFPPWPSTGTTGKSG
jgi:DNA repair exonuclease SbcCD nuclease subunit